MNCVGDSVKPVLFPRITLFQLSVQQENRGKMSCVFMTINQRVPWYAFGAYVWFMPIVMI